jgi:methyl-accepting chemotaxis protein
MEQEAKQNLEKINSFKSQFMSILDDYKKYYVYYNKNPEVDEFQQNFFNAKSQLQQIMKQLTNLSESIKDETSSLNSQMQNINRKIKLEKNLNGKLDKTVSGLESTNNSSKALIDDSKEEYNAQYVKNWEMILGLFIIGFILAYRFESREFFIKCTQYIKSKASGSTTTSTIGI